MEARGNLRGSRASIGGEAPKGVSFASVETRHFVADSTALCQTPIERPLSPIDRPASSSDSGLGDEERTTFFPSLADLVEARTPDGSSPGSRGSTSMNDPIVRSIMEMPAWNVNNFGSLPTGTSPIAEDPRENAENTLGSLSLSDVSVTQTEVVRRDPADDHAPREPRNSEVPVPASGSVPDG